MRDFVLKNFVLPHTITNIQNNIPEVSHDL